MSSLRGGATLMATVADAHAPRIARQRDPEGAGTALVAQGRIALVQHDLGGATFGGRGRLGMKDVGGLQRTVGSQPAAQRAARYQGIDLGRRTCGDGRRFIGRRIRGQAADRSRLLRHGAGRQLRQARRGARTDAYRQLHGNDHDGWTPHHSQAPRWVGAERRARWQPTIVHRTLEESFIARQGARRQGN